MARRPHPEEVALKIKVPRGIEGYWSIMLDLGRDGGTFSVPDVDVRSNTDKATISGYVSRLVKAGYLVLDHTRPSAKGSPQRFYRIAKLSAEAPRVRRDGSEAPRDQQWRLWATIRLLKRGFTAEELAFNAGLEEAVPIRTVRSYIQHLERAGYLGRVGIAKAGKPITYRLLRDTGPKPPMVLATRSVWDQNQAAIVGDSVTEAAS
ncbi:hypothetical protein [Kaistia sp. MMO-174]|uniref:hypothetical protein n=1 Tax=Kaistia sp. MMO-174 TaxID=3081256 RepID=UPI003019FFD4